MMLKRQTPPPPPPMDTATANRLAQRCEWESLLNALEGRRC
jgi:hypothetical protein